MEYALAAPAILAAWETGARRRPLDRALAILWAAGVSGHCDPADLPIVERDRLLLWIRAHTFGPGLPARATCPDCGAELEMELDANRLADALPPANADDGPLRPLTSRDLAAISELPPDQLLATLRVRLSRAGTDVGIDMDAEALDHQIEQDASAAELSARITCSECGTDWPETLDVTAHLWTGIETAAMRLMSEVSELAATYGWTESEILSLGPARRRAYLSLARQT